MIRLNDDEIQEWYEIVLKQRNHYRCILQDIVCGVPTSGMASPYRQLKLDEIKAIARKALED